MPIRTINAMNDQIRFGRIVRMGAIKQLNDTGRDEFIEWAESNIYKEISDRQIGQGITPKGSGKDKAKGGESGGVLARGNAQCCLEHPEDCKIHPPTLQNYVSKLLLVNTHHKEIDNLKIKVLPEWE